MNETEFINELKELNFNDGLIIPVYWYVDDDEKVVVDYDEMKAEFELKLKEIEDIQNE